MNRVLIRMLPDGTGRVRIHWFEWLDDGPIQPVPPLAMSNLGPMTLKAHKMKRGRIACMPKLESLAPQVQNGLSQLVVHSDDPRAATCPECMATEGYRKTMALMSELEAGASEFVEVK